MMKAKSLIYALLALTVLVYFLGEIGALDPKPRLYIFTSIGFLYGWFRRVRDDREVALKFADWLMENCTLAEDSSLWSYEGDDYTNEKLFEIFKEI